MTLTDFLLARIAEDEAAARQEDADYADTSLLPTYDSEHQARWTTGRVLAECEAKRRIIAEHELTTDTYPVDTSPSRGVSCTLCYGTGPGESAEDLGPCDTLRALAQVYADHPDFDPSWATPE